ncbi:M23 family metallopeptidase [Microbacterium sp. BG28]|uniref:M23 family metallopeptidase n=1 Tax=Microbacterium sp. BG28 TaxID=3097356 RepID=UPI002A5A9828|nr:M23 family metallopeptidase [Microbacterium sp. BG28]MDY0827538.1 M23 family metallopeptidase [Microbacterium sp. BG28]
MNAADFYRTEPTGSQAYGAPRDDGKRTHTGDDFSHSTKPDTVPVPAILAGRVTAIQRERAGLTNGYGNQVTVTHPDGSRFTYGHLARVSVALGQDLDTGTVVGTEGETGWTSGPCVHVEYLDPQGRRQDPYPHIRAAIARPMTITKPEDDDMNICLYLYTPTNHLLLVDHMNKRIRDLGDSATDPVRDHYSQQPYTRVGDLGNAEKLPDWAEITKGYTYV